MIILRALSWWQSCWSACGLSCQQSLYLPVCQPTGLPALLPCRVLSVLWVAWSSPARFPGKDSEPRKRVGMRGTKRAQKESGVAITRLLSSAQGSEVAEEIPQVAVPPVAFCSTSEYKSTGVGAGLRCWVPVDLRVFVFSSSPLCLLQEVSTSAWHPWVSWEMLNEVDKLPSRLAAKPGCSRCPICSALWPATGCSLELWPSLKWCTAHVEPEDYGVTQVSGINPLAPGRIKKGSDINRQHRAATQTRSSDCYYLLQCLALGTQMLYLF